MRAEAVRQRLGNRPSPLYGRRPAIDAKLAHPVIGANKDSANWYWRSMAKELAVPANGRPEESDGCNREIGGFPPTYINIHLFA